MSCKKHSRYLPAPSAWSLPVRWLVLALVSACLGIALELIGLSAAFLLGPMIAAILLSVVSGPVRISHHAQLAAQGVVGVMIASALPPTVFHEMASDWPVFLVGVNFTIVASGVLGWLLYRLRVMPGTTAIWGSAPGAATVMTLMSDAYGADMRLVALMQYLRVVACVLATTLIARLLGLHSAAVDRPETVWFPGGEAWISLPEALCVVLAGIVIGTRLRVPGGAMMVPMMIGVFAKVLGLPISLSMPMPVLALAFAVVGWGIGMRFTRGVLRHALALFPYLLLSTMTLILVCGAFGYVLAQFANVDLLTAYLATSPGGADSVAIIASSTQADMPFITVMQVLRFFTVLVVGPALAGWLSRRYDSQANGAFPPK